MKIVFKKDPSIQIIAPKIKIIKSGNYGWYEVENCTDSGYEKILAPFSMAFWKLIEQNAITNIVKIAYRTVIDKIESLSHKKIISLFLVGSLKM